MYKIFLSFWLNWKFLSFNWFRSENSLKKKSYFCPIVKLGSKKWCRQHKGLWLNNLLVELWYCTSSLLRHVTSNLAYFNNWWTIFLKLNLHISWARFSKDIFWHFNLCSRNESSEKTLFKCEFIFLWTPIWHTFNVGGAIYAN